MDGTMVNLDGLLKNAMTKLKDNEQFTAEEHMKIYTVVYKTCARMESLRYSQQLYDKYKETLQDDIDSTVLTSMREKNDEYLLRELVKRWSNHKIMVRCLSCFFNYLERYFIPQRSLPTLEEVGLCCFRGLVVKGKARDALIVLIGRERCGEQIDRALLKNVLDIFVEMGMECYEEDFEKSLLEESALYYSQKASNWILDDSCPAYMLKSEECLEKERDRVSHYLHSSTVPKLEEKVIYELLIVYANQLLENEHSGCLALLQDDKVEDLSRMYRLYNKTPKGLEHVSAIFKQHIAEEGTVLVQQALDAASSQTSKSISQTQVLIRKIIEMNDKYMAYVVGCFENHRLFREAMFEAFKIFCNKTVPWGNCAKLSAMFCHNIIKKGGSEKLSDEAIEEALGKVVDLLEYISDNDLFAEFYRERLAVRLIYNLSANDDHERSILTKLKLQFGTQPAEMVRGVEAFQAFYDSKTKPQKLRWIYSLSSCHLNGFFDAKTIELNVSTYQATLLLLFNTADRLSYTEIMDRMKLTHDDLVGLLHSLCCSKYKILIKDGSTNNISQSDRFKFNNKFNNRMSRIKIPRPHVEKVATDWSFTIDAAIVRMMKSRKELLLEQLISECEEQLSRYFKPEIKAIRKRVEYLIAREYMERDKENVQILKYIP